MLPELDVINMNGRLYDPITARMILQVWTAPVRVSIDTAMCTTIP